MLLDKIWSILWRYSSLGKFSIIILLLICSVSQLLYENIVVKVLILFLTAVLGIYELIQDWIKPIYLQNNLSIQKIEKIVYESKPQDWSTYHPSNNIIEKVHKMRPEIRLILEDLDDSDFTETWCSNRVHRGGASKVNCTIACNNNRIKTKVLVYVDDGRALLPLPSIDTRDSETREANFDDYALARIFDENNSLDNYLKIYRFKIIFN